MMMNSFETITHVYYHFGECCQCICVFCGYCGCKNVYAKSIASLFIVAKVMERGPGGREEVRNENKREKN